MGSDLGCKKKKLRISSHRRCLYICSIRDFGAFHTDTLETTVGINAHLVLCAVVLSCGTLINVCEETATQ